MANKPEYLCRNCLLSMCDDCLNVSEEYEELNKRLKVALWQMEEKLKEVAKAEQRAQLAEQRAADWERLMKLGQNKLILAWIDSQRLPDLVSTVERVVR
jgi:hypothetical protein